MESKFTVINNIIFQKKSNVNDKSNINYRNILLIIVFLTGLISIIIAYQIHNYIYTESNIISQTSDKYKAKVSDLLTQIKSLEEEIDNSINTIPKLENQFDNATLRFRLLSLNLSQEQEKNKNLYLELSYKNNVQLSGIFTNITEVKQLLNLIEKGLRKKNFSPVLTLLYRATNDGDTRETFIKAIQRKSNIIILIKSSENIVFGGFLFEKVNRGTDTSDNRAFLFSLLDGKIFPKKKNALTYKNNDSLFSFGNEDIVIYDKFLNNNATKIFFPLSYGNNNKDKSNSFTQIPYGVTIKELEIYKIKY